MGGGAERVAARMRLHNPRFVPREWMLVEAYDAAAAGDFGPVEKLLELFSRPYDEQTAAEGESRFFRRELAMESKPGVAFMT